MIDGRIGTGSCQGLGERACFRPSATRLGVAGKSFETEEYMKRMQLILLAAMAVCAFVSFSATSAMAAGPLWLVNGVRYDCEKAGPGHKFDTLLNCLKGSPELGGEWELSTLTGTSGKLLLDQSALALGLNLGTFKLHTSLITIECTSLDSPTSLVGGTPGKDHAIIIFKGCSVEGKTSTECHVNSPGEPVGTIATSAKTELVYIGTKEEAEKETGPLGDLFEPEESGKPFVTLEVAGTKCPIFTEGTNKVEGSVVGEATPVETMGTEGMLKFPSPIIGKAFRWVKAGEVTEVKPSLKVFGFVNAEQIGLADVKLLSGEEWGVTRK
jgi:hypothetical protein